jgi:hypothetical protein
MVSRAPRSVVLVALLVVAAAVGAAPGAAAPERGTPAEATAADGDGPAPPALDPGASAAANDSGTGDGGDAGADAEGGPGPTTASNASAAARAGDAPPPATDVVLDPGGGVEPQSPPSGATRVVLVGTGADVVEPGDVRAAGGEVVGVDGRRVEARVPLAALPALRTLEWVASVRPAPVSVPTTVGGGVAVVGADDLHAANLTGENVSVGVVDAGFDPNATDVADQVVAARAFGAGLSERPTHGTGVAEVVAETAPGADLHLAAYRGSTNYARAVEWLVEADVDVVVMAVAWLGEPADGTGYVSRTAASAVDEGAVWVGSVGNYAEKHWQGRFNDTTGDRVHDFGGTVADPDEVNYLSDPDDDDDRWRLEPGDTVYAVLEWDDWPGEDVAAWRNESDDYDLHLFYYGDGANDTETVARARQSHDGWDAPVEVLEYTVDREGSYGLYVSREQDGPGDPTIELFTVDTGPPEYSVPTGSVVAPAASERTVAVGAFRYDTGEREAFSSVGPTDDGRRGVDLLGPDGFENDVYGEFVGTSAAAPSVAGVAALLRGANPTLSPAGVEERLAATADDAGPPGPDTRSGYGRVDAAAAVAPDVRVDGRLLADGEAAAAERVLLRRPGGAVTAANRTAADGRFRLYLRPNGTQDLVVSDLDDAGTRDGLPDLYALRRFEPPGGAALGEVRLPDGHPVSVRVVDEFGRPVANATARVAHERDGATAAVRLRTDETGTGVLPAADARRLELAGTVSVTATPPPGSRAVAADVELEVRVTESRDVTLSLPVRARVGVTNVTAPAVVSGDEPLVVNATVLNRGGSIGSATRVSVRLDRDRDGRFEAEESLANRSVLASPGAPTPVTFETGVDAPSGEYPLAVVTPNDTATRTVRLRRAANLTPSIDAPRNVSVDGVVPVRVTVENRGGEVGNLTPVELRLDEDRDGRLTGAETRATRTVSPAPGENESLRFDLSTDGLVPGRYAVAAVTRDGAARTRLDVMVPALYEVNLTAPAAVSVGDEPTLAATVRNGGGDLGATTTLSVRLDRDGDGGLDADETVAARRVRVVDGGSTTVEVPLSTLGVPPGEYALGVVVGTGNVSERVPLTVRASHARLAVTRTAVPTVPTNGSAAVEVAVRNVGGNLSRDLGASLAVDWDGNGDFASDETLAAVPVSLASGERRTVRATVPGDRPEGEYPLRISTPNETVERTLVVGATPFPDGLPQVGGGDGPRPVDVDDDGLYEDVDGDGRVALSDAFALAFADLDAVNDDPAMRDALDFDGDGRVALPDAFHYAFEFLDSRSG